MDCAGFLQNDLAVSRPEKRLLGVGRVGAPFSLAAGAIQITGRVNNASIPAIPGMRGTP